MANALFDGFLPGLAAQRFDLDHATIRLLLVAGYPYRAADSTVADVTGTPGVRLSGTSEPLAGLSLAGGRFTADPCVIRTRASARGHRLVVFQASAPHGGRRRPRRAAAAHRVHRRHAARSTGQRHRHRRVGARTRTRFRAGQE